jgi:hypothetical protein
MNRLFLAISFLILTDISCLAQKTQIISVSNKNIKYEGRINFKTADEAELYWSGTSIKINFDGTEVSAFLKDERLENWYNVIIDEDSIYKINPDTTKKLYTLASNLKKGKHSIEIYKRTEWDKGKSWFYGFQLSKDAKLLSPSLKKKRIEFFGNSITCGYGIEDYSGNDSGAGFFENNYLTYAALTSRHFNAETHYTAKSGIGITISWFPLVMKEMYDRLDPTNPQSRWDFSKFTPDLVVVNLFQNDSWLVERPEHESFKEKFGTTKPTPDFITNEYYQFIRSIRSKYPKAHIICALGNMDATREGSPWPGYIEKAVARLGDSKIYTHFFTYKDTPGHPKVEEQKVMSESLIKFIEEKLNW